MPTGSAARRRGEAGFTLPFLIGILTVLAIVLAAALPVWVARVQRAKEAELVARGLQYAEAIRVFQSRFGRLPSRLEELVELEPRSIRQLWKNPFAKGDDPGWYVLMEVGGQVVPLDPRTGELATGAEGTQDEGGTGAEGDERGVGAPVGSNSPTGGAPATLGRGTAPRGAAAPQPATSTGNGSEVAGPIHGVRSKVRGEAYRSYFDQKDFGDWDFSVERLAQATGATTPDGTLRRADYGSIGRSFAYPPPGGKSSGGLPPGGGAGGIGNRGGGPNPQPPEAEPPAVEDEENE